jgi:class 3 adenylate cyclase/DNA-binding NarL/FixJ family response regulator
MPAGRISVFLSDDSLIVREGVRALIALEPDLEVVGVAADYDGLVAGAGEAAPQVVVTDIRMPPTFQREGIEAAKEVRKRHPGTGIVILSQYREPEFAISLLSEGAAGCAYLLKDRVAEGDQLARAIRAVATGGSVLDPEIVQAIVTPVREERGLTPPEEELLRLVAEGRSIKAIAAAQRTTPAIVAESIEQLFLKLAEGASAGVQGSLERLRLLHHAIVEREEQGETLSRFLPGGVAEKVRREGRQAGESTKVVVTVLMSDIRSYTTIAERTDPARLAAQLNVHRGEMQRAIIERDGCVMQFAGDAVMAVFGAPLPHVDHADRALAAAMDMHERQAAVNARWATEGLEAFELGIGLSTGEVAEAILGSDERVEYTVVGDVVNLTQRIQQWAEPGQIVMTEATRAALSAPIEGQALEPALVKGRRTPVSAHRIDTVKRGG